ncbi:MAG: PEP-CTERM system TPR-repeat protein PrsT [Burkholderiaceae bacterium]|nr:PEP-CTERM system TPR-repeat protein PrsT [Burkholderiaceae bacterium]
MDMQKTFSRFIPVAAAALVLSAALAGCGSGSEGESIGKAKAYLEKRDDKAAIIELKDALQKNPSQAEARYLLGSALLRAGDAVASEVELRKALDAKHPAEFVVPELARAMQSLGQAKKVVDEFGNARFNKPAADASLQTTLAWAYRALGKPEESSAALGAALTADPGYAPALILDARRKATGRNPDAALAIVEAVIGREPGNTEAWKLKGDILQYALNRPGDALEAYRRALQADPRFLAGHFDVLALLMQQGRLDEAATQLDQLKKVAAQHPQTRFFEAQLAYQRKDFKSARELSQQLLRVASKNPRVLQLAGAVELQLGAYAQAETFLSRALQAAPDLSLARRMLMATYLRSGQLKKAQAALESALDSGAVDPSMYSLAGEIYLQNGDAKKAEQYFVKALKQDPEDASRRTAVAMSHLAGGKAAEALDELKYIAASDKGVTADMALISVYVRRNELDKALLAIDRLEAKQPDKPTAANLRGRVQLARKDTAAARKSFERALSIDPNFFAASASLAALDMADKKPDDARKRFEVLLAKNPKNGQALIALAGLAAERGAGKDEVAALLTRAVDADPTDVATRQALIDLFLRHKDNKQALAAAQNAVAAVPNSPELLYALGRVQQLSGDLHQAMATYGKLIAQQPLTAQPHFRLAEVQMASKDGQAARQSLRKALEIRPDHLAAQQGLIVLNLEEKKYADARKVALTVQEQRPKSPEGFVMEGDIANAQKNWGAAASSYRAALQRRASPAIATKLHSVVVASGKTAEADAFAATWVKEHPTDALFLAYQAEQALARKDYAAAEKHYRAALRITPDNVFVLNNLAWVSGQLGKEDAAELAEKANKLAPDQPMFMDTLAMLLADKGEFARAIELEKKALALQPGNAGVRLNLARIYIKSGDKPRARAELDTLAKMGAKLGSQAEVSALLKSL